MNANLQSNIFKIERNTNKLIPLNETAADSKYL